MNNIILIGMMGSGKTTVGKALSLRLGKRHLDTDQIIEETQGLSIERIFDQSGEARFRELEESVIEKISDIEGVVLSTGGGIILSPINSMRLKQMGTVVYLRGSSEQLNKNLQDEFQNRPMLKTNSLDVILKVRAGLYENTAHHIIEIDGRNIDEIVDEILKLDDR